MDIISDQKAGEALDHLDEAMEKTSPALLAAGLSTIFGGAAAASAMAAVHTAPHPVSAVFGLGAAWSAVVAAAPVVAGIGNAAKTAVERFTNHNKF